MHYLTAPRYVRIFGFDVSGHWLIPFTCRELGWEDKESRIVVIKHLFHPSEAKEDPFTFFEDLKNDLEIEAGRCGEIQTIKIFEVINWLLSQY